VNRRIIDIDGGSVIAYGHYGRPLVAFPSENGEPHDWEDRGMVEAIAPLLDDGKVKLYCTPSFDRDSWTRGDLTLEERARRHGHYEWWVLTKLVPFVQADSHTHELMAAGSSFGAYHSVNFCLKRSDIFPLAIGMSGVYDVSVQGGGERGEAVYFNNPMDYVTNLQGDHSTGCAGRPPSCSSAARGSGRTRPVRSTRRSGSGRCSRRRASRSRSTCGATTCRTTGPPGAASSPTICQGSSRE
jgi:esterase/lipase superfamily enzyme